MSASVSQRSGASANPTRQQLEELDALLNRMLELPVRKEDDEGEAPSPRPATREPKTPPPVAPSRSSRMPVAAETRPVQDRSAPPPPEPERRSVAPEIDSKSTYGDVSPAAPEFRVPNPDDWIQLAATWQPSAQTWGPLAETWKQTTRPVGARKTPEEYSQPSAPVPAAQSPANATTPMRDDDAVLSGLARERHASGLSGVLANSAPAPAANAHPLPSLASLGAPIVTQPASTLSTEAAVSAVSTVSAPSTPSTSWVLWPLVAFNSGFDLCLAPFGPLGQFLKGRTGRKLLGACGICCLALGLALPVADNNGWLNDAQLLVKDWFGWTR